MRDFILGVDQWLKWHEDHMTQQQKLNAFGVITSVMLWGIIIIGILLDW